MPDDQVAINDQTGAVVLDPGCTTAQMGAATPEAPADPVWLIVPDPAGTPPGRLTRALSDCGRDVEAVVTASPGVDALKEIDAAGRVTGTVDRTRVMFVGPPLAVRRRAVPRLDPSRSSPAEAAVMALRTMVLDTAGDTLATVPPPGEPG